MNTGLSCLLSSTTKSVIPLIRPVVVISIKIRPEVYQRNHNIVLQISLCKVSDIIFSSFNQF